MESVLLSGKVTPWSNDEVQAFVAIIGDCSIQRQLDGATRNEKVFAVVADQMASQGFNRTSLLSAPPGGVHFSGAKVGLWKCNTQHAEPCGAVRAGQIEPVEKGH
ncbi:hypothetical protein CRENBAI_022207 [Crenichthys baileyi]|uniref:Myb/SANT-like DNA-binding domain-containing protein n=1 Tax=Crenichthys baileyi TaxID=28760 RepID=A0AAV9SDX0_9TELE